MSVISFMALLHRIDIDVCYYDITITSKKLFIFCDITIFVQSFSLTEVASNWTSTVYHYMSLLTATACSFVRNSMEFYMYGC